MDIASWKIRFIGISENASGLVGRPSRLKFLSWSKQAALQTSYSWVIFLYLWFNILGRFATSRQKIAILLLCSQMEQPEKYQVASDESGADWLLSKVWHWKLFWRKLKVWVLAVHNNHKHTINQTSSHKKASDCLSPESRNTWVSSWGWQWNIR